MDTFSRDLAIEAVRADASFVGAMVEDQKRGVASTISAMSFYAYTSLMLYEARRALTTLELAVPPIDRAGEAMLANSRHSLKFFEDTNPLRRGVGGILTVMQDEIIPAHRKRFLGNTWFPPARVFETDLGIYVLNGQPFSTTHALTFLMGFPPESIGDDRKLREFLLRVGEQYGAAFAALRTKSLRSTEEEPTLLPDAKLGRALDRRSEKVYGAIFNGPTTPSLNAALTILLTSVQFALNGFTSGDESHSYTHFKIKFVTAYQVTSSLRALRNDQNEALTEASRRHLRDMTSSPEANELLDRCSRRLRNTIVHYVPAANVDGEQVKGESLVNGLITLTGCRREGLAYRTLVEEQLIRLRDGLIAWFGRLK